MKKTLLISALSVAMVGMPTFQASASSLLGGNKAQEEVAKDVDAGTESLQSAAGKTKEGITDVASAVTDVVQDIADAGNSYYSALEKLQDLPAIKQRETMITCAAAGGTTGLMSHYLRSKTPFSQEAKLSFARKILRSTKGFGKGAALGIIAGMYFFEPQVQSKTALDRTPEEKSTIGYKAAGAGLLAAIL